MWFKKYRARRELEKLKCSNHTARVFKSRLQECLFAVRWEEPESIKTLCVEEDPHSGSEGYEC